MLSETFPTMLYTDIYALIVPYLSWNSIPAFTASCSEFRDIFWSVVNLKRDNCLALRLAVMRRALASLELMLARFKGAIPARITKLAILAGSDVVELLLQHDVNIDEVCLSLAIALRDAKLFETLLSKAKRQVLHSDHIIDILNSHQDEPTEFMTIIRSSSQFRTLVIDRKIRTLPFLEELPELNLYGRGPTYIRNVGLKHDLSRMGIDPEAPVEERVVQVRKVNKGTKENWTISPCKAYEVVRGRPVQGPLPDPDSELNDDTKDINLLVAANCRAVVSLAIKRQDEPEVALAFPKEVIDEMVKAETLGLVLESQSTTPFVEDLLTPVYMSRHVGMLRPLWLSGRGLPTPYILYKYPQETWLFNLIIHVILYWDDVRRISSSA